MDTDRTKLAPGSPAAQHPDWVIEYGGKLYYDPGLPQVRELTTDVILEVVRRYDVDGVHFDDYFYPYPVAGQDFADDATFAAPRRRLPRHPGGPGRLAPRQHRQADRGPRPAHPPGQALGAVRGQPVRRVAQRGDRPGGLRHHGRRARPTTTSTPTPAAGCARSGSTTSRRRSTGTSGSPPADYGVLVPWWSEQVAGTDVQLYVGQATYKVGVEPAQDPAWHDPQRDEPPPHLQPRLPRGRRRHLLLRQGQVRANRLGHMDLVQAEHYAHPALLPVTEGVPGRRPDAVRRLDADRRGLRRHAAVGGLRT